jgi:glycosyltransferase involved in cell wall biosynthesis
MSRAESACAESRPGESSVRVVFVSVLPLWSGGVHESGGPAFSRTVQAYLNAGHEVHLITLDPSTRCFEAPNFHVHVVAGEIAWLPKRLAVYYLRYNVVFPLAALFRFLVLLFRKGVDLIYGYEVDGILAALPMSRLSGRPLVSRFQGTVLAPLLEPGTPLKAKLPYVSHFLGFKVLADLAIMTDDGTLGDQVMRKLNPRLAARTKFWRNGIDPRPPEMDVRPIRSEATIAPGARVLLTVSRLVGWKRVDRAIAALPAILESVPDVALVIVGDGPEKDRLRALAVERGVERSVYFRGNVPHSQVFSCYDDAEVFLSLYDLSNLGNPLLEAMRCGKPIITIRNGGTGTVIEHGVNGILLDNGTPSEVAGAVVSLLHDPSERARLGRNAACYAQNHFWTWDERMREELAAVQALLK